MEVKDIYTSIKKNPISLHFLVTITFPLALYLLVHKGYLVYPIVCNNTMCFLQNTLNILEQLHMPMCT